MNNFYCAAPWRGLHISPNGSVKTCCAGNPNMLGNLDQQSIESILDGDKIKEIRASLKQGQAHAYCSNCVKAERSGASSERDWHNRANKNFDFDTAGTEYHFPVIVDVRWNTTCNQSCNYCNEMASSKWASIKRKDLKAQTKSYYDLVSNFILKRSEHIHELAMVGGEPLLLPENDRLLDLVPSTAIITLITNLNVDFDTNVIVKKLAQRNRVGWSISFDNIQERFEYVRYGGNWSTLERNIARVKEFFRELGHWGGIHAVYNVYNCTRLVEFKQWAREQNLNIVWQDLFFPSYLDPRYLGQSVTNLAAAEIEKLFELDLVDRTERQFFSTKLEQLKTVESTQVNSFQQHLKDIETLWHPDQQGQFQKLWPEFKDLCL